MKKLQKLVLMTLFVSVTMIGSGFAFATSQSDVTVAGLNAGLALKSGGFGALAGVLLSVFTVWNKNQSQTGVEKIDPRKLGVNLVLGAGIGVVMSVIGVDVTNSQVQSVLTTIVPLAVNYMFLHFFNLSLRPMFGNWIKGNKATDTTTK